MIVWSEGGDASLRLSAQRTARSAQRKPVNIIDWRKASRTVGSFLVGAALCGALVGCAQPPAEKEEESRGSGPEPADIHLFDVTWGGELPALGSHVAVTDRDGYDNQPSFSADSGSIFYTSGRDGQTDIYRYDVAAANSAAVIQTAEREYSPQQIQDDAGTWISHVQVEEDGAQRLWKWPLGAGSPRGRRALERLPGRLLRLVQCDGRGDRGGRSRLGDHGAYVSPICRRSGSPSTLST